MTGAPVKAPPTAPSLFSRPRNRTTGTSRRGNGWRNQDYAKVNQCTLTKSAGWPLENTR